MERRIYGIETEFGLTCATDGKRRLTPDEVARYLFRSVVRWGRSSNVFLGNGSRLYLDVGSHPEYATAECDDLLDLVAHDCAGEQIVQDLVDDAQERLAEDEIAGEIFVFKNNVDSAGNSYGCHENFLVARSDDFARVTEQLLPFLITRQLIAGTGKIMRPSTGPVFSVSQRADHMWEGVSSATTRSRPIINTRDEPHADAERYRRMHVIVGDSTMTETTTLLKVGSASLVLRMLEAGVQLPDLGLENPIRSIRDISLDITGRAPVRLRDGSTTTGLAIQQLYLEQVSDFVAAEGIDDPVTARILDLWSRTLQAIETGRLDLVATEIDWVVKYRLLDAYAQRGGLGLDHPRLAQLDLAYHDIDPQRGVHRLLQRAGKVARVVDDERVAAAVQTPPQSTRAKLRGDFVRAAREAGRDFTVDWVHLKLNDGNQRTVLCKDPFAAVDSRVDALMDAVRA
ncbi:Pup--protein ligase [Marihabitans asiaticum]|uniref:Pup--protein ligase n=1 Tax=Marihabitans asiaticum TaxID=415218 RepID=A0A560W6H6_9MICO|nr:Pup--protein ligase [Marihabitans asiaticum]TWD13222.1 proteasome accessory factor A [Marihabitans asiaticum]